ncbi:MAG TPA: NADH-quinone oxidoreductase subunit C [Terriglobales bacterium]|nr:NADH-quinone oxidoreductase subunit C [Terriglobales bacterium]
MSEETKSPAPPPSGEPKPPAGQPIASGAQSTPAQKPAEKHAAPAKPAGPAPVPWESPLVAKLKAQYGSGVREANTYLGQNYLVLEPSIAREALQILRDEEEFDYCVDVTAVHYPNREKPFDLIWILYSFARNQRLRVKTMLADGESFPSSVAIWPTANWLEREVFDMFGIKFDGHPDLKRILLPDDWKGHPLRKDYGIIQQDQEWVKANLGIESGQ